MPELFKTNPEKMEDLLNEVHKCEIQLPDFQRGWVWDEERVKKLLISILKQYPIGAVMMLDAGNENAQFSSVVLKNVVDNYTEPKRLLLDGQQRLTSLYQTLKYKGAVDTVNTKNKNQKRYYYFNIAEIIKENGDEDEFVIIANQKKFSNRTGTVIEYDYRDIDKECENNVFPTNLVLDIPSMQEWSMKYTSNGTNVEKQQIWNKFFVKMLDIAKYSIPVISLTKENKKEAVCSVFENVNTGGIALNVFELLTATFAANDYRLRYKWEEDIQVELKNNSNYKDVLQDVSNVDFLQSLTLVATDKRQNQAVACKRKNILDLTLEEFKSLYLSIQNGYISAARFLSMQHIYSYKDIPYGSQLIPLAAIFAKLGKKAEIAMSIEKIERWYWCGVFGELYGGANETRFVRDYVELCNFIDDDTAEIPDTIKVSSFREDRLDEMKTKNSAAYKGIGALLLKNKAMDFKKGYSIDNITKYNSVNIDIHHIFPKSYCEKVGIPKEKYESIVNKAPLSYDTNREIGRRCTKYLYC